MEKLIIQYSAIKNGVTQHYLKEVSRAKYNVLYVPSNRRGKIFNLEILPL